MTEINELPWCKHGINKSGYCAECKVASLITTIESQKEEIESLKWKIAHPVICQGICTSQLDDYYGMHMSNESCIACNAIWTEAHIENAVFSYKAITELAAKENERWNSLRPEVQWFAEQIELTLKANDHKTGWIYEDSEYFLRDQIDKHLAIFHIQEHGLSNFVSIGAYAMMLADKINKEEFSNAQT